MLNGSDTSSYGDTFSLKQKSTNTGPSSFTMEDKGSISSWKGSVYSWNKDKDKDDSSDIQQTERQFEDEKLSGVRHPSEFASQVSALSTANMKQHDLEQKMMIENAPPSVSLGGKQKRKKKHRRKHRKKNVRLPLVESLVSREFPLPGPKQIAMYSQAADSVQLLPRLRDGSSSSVSSFLDSDKSSG